MKKGEKISTDSLEENGWIQVCSFQKGDLQVWANGTLRIVRRVKNAIIILLYDRKDFKRNYYSRICCFFCRVASR